MFVSGLYHGQTLMSTAHKEKRFVKNGKRHNPKIGLCLLKRDNFNGEKNDKDLINAAFFFAFPLHLCQDK